MSKILDRMILDLAEARKNQDTFIRQTLITLVGECSPGGNEKVTDEKVQKIVKKFYKNCQDMLVYAKDPSHHSNLLNEAAIYSRYLPTQLGENSIREIILEEFGDNVPKNIGKVMGFLAKNYKDQYDGKLVVEVIKKIHQ